MPPSLSLPVAPQHVGNPGLGVLADVAKESSRYALLAEQMIDERLVATDRRSRYRDGSRAGCVRVKDRSWYEREAWRFEW